MPLSALHTLITAGESQTLEFKTIVAIDVAEFPVKPISTKGRYYKRVASSNRAYPFDCQRG